MSLTDDTQMNKDHIVLLGLSACAFGFSIFVLLGPKLGRRNVSNRALVGLQNLGLTCFLNSLLQALASCPSFIEWLRSTSSNGNVSESLYAILKLLCYERQPDLEEVHSPDDLLYSLKGKHWPSFPQEQDPQELFLHILTLLEEEEQKSNPERIQSLLDALGPLDGDNGRYFSQVSSHGDVPRVRRIMPLEIDKPKLIPSPFRGYLASKLCCNACGNKSAVVYDKFDSISLALPPKGESFKLQRLLDDFVSAETVEGFACDYCNKGRNPKKPPKLTRASKAIKIGKLPKCLCFHISRTYIDSSGYMYKRGNYVDFPEYLSMTDYTHTSSMLKDKKLKKSLSARTKRGVNVPIASQSAALSGSIGISSEDDYETAKSSEYETAKSSEASDRITLPSANKRRLANAALLLKKKLLGGSLYRLKAVVEHLGTVETGHFVTYRRGPLQSDITSTSSQLLSKSESKWFFTSDEMVRSTHLADVLSANAYLLFYEKCSPPQSS